MTREIPLTQGQVAIVDAADYEWLAQWKWHAHWNPISGFYAARHRPRVNGKGGTIRMHRVIMAAPADMLVDHINHDGLDNRRANLRLCTTAENQRNCRSRKGSSSAYLGVCWHKEAGRWQVRIKIDGRTKHIGYFACEIEAARAYDAAAREYHGAFANPNFGEYARGKL